MKVSNFVSIWETQNGKIKTKYDVHQEANIYRKLREMGFSKTPNKNIYYNKEGRITDISHIRNTFYDFLCVSDFEDIKSNFMRSEILEWYLRKTPIKRNDLFNRILEGLMN